MLSSHHDSHPFLIRPVPIRVPPLTARASELPRIVDEYALDAISKLGAVDRQDVGPRSRRDDPGRHRDGDLATRGAQDLGDHHGRRKSARGVPVDGSEDRQAARDVTH